MSPGEASLFCSCIVGDVALFTRRANHVLGAVHRAATASAVDLSKVMSSIDAALVSEYTQVSDRSPDVRGQSSLHEAPRTALPALVENRVNFSPSIWTFAFIMSATGCVAQGCAVKVYIHTASAQSTHILSWLFSLPRGDWQRPVSRSCDHAA